MKSYLPIIILLLILFSSSALLSQAKINEDFENYKDGDQITIISSDWKLWPKGTDASVTKSKASSGKKSLKLEGGKRTDLYFPFKKRFTAGHIQFSLDILIPEGGEGYFSLQGNETPGEIWSMQCYLNKNAYFSLVENYQSKIENIYPQGRWFTFSVDINFKTHLWRFYIDGACVGSYVQDKVENQSVASLGLFPKEDDSVFYVDNISFKHRGKVKGKKIKRDATILQVLDPEFDLAKKISQSFVGVNGTTQKLGCHVKNVGSKHISSLELELARDGQKVSQVFQVDLPPAADTVIILDEEPVYKGEFAADLSIKQINESKDDNLCNNTVPIQFKGVDIQHDKKVWVEEATGTWCPWCPRGTVFMNYLATKYPDHFVGIAVHHNDPMAFIPWVGSQGGRMSMMGKRRKPGSKKKVEGLVSHIKGFPSAFVNRTDIVDPGNLEIAFLESVAKKPLATMTHSAKWDAQTRELEVTVVTNLKEATNADVRLIVGLTEDKVSGQGEEWAQQNAYAGGKSGLMAGYESKPSTIVAKEIEYDNVAKYLFTPFAGDSIRKNEFQPEATTIIRTFTHTIPGDWNLENMHIVSGVTIETDEIQNANKTSISEALGK